MICKILAEVVQTLVFTDKFDKSDFLKISDKFIELVDS